jgi:hypothetical protein
MNKALKAIVVIIVLFATAYVITGCNTEKRALRKTQRFLFEHPEFSAGYCAEQYPVKDSVRVRDSIYYDTIYQDPAILEYADAPADASIPAPDENPPQMEAPTIKYIIKTHRKDSIIYRRDGAEERRLQLALQACQGNNNDLQNKYAALEEDRNAWKGKAKTRWLWIALLIGGAIGYTVIKFRKNILSIKNKLT